MGSDELEGHLVKLNATAASLLGLLHRGPMSGWDLARMAETVIGDFWNVSQSQVYRELRTLDDAGLVDAGPSGKRGNGPTPSPPKAKPRSPSGYAENPGPTSSAHRSPLMLMVFFARHLDDIHLRRFMAIQRLRHEQTLDEYRKVYDTAAADEPDLANVVQFAIFHEEAVQRWFEWMDKQN